MAKMYTRDHIPRKTVVRMDPDCAICHAPATMACDYVLTGGGFFANSAWVRAHAQDYILEYFRLLTERRKAAHMAHLDRISAHAYHYYHSPPHPNEIAAAQATLKRGIDEDWQCSVQRYPEVLEYFYSLVELTLPSDDEAAESVPQIGRYRRAPQPIRRKPSRTGAPLATEVTSTNRSPSRQENAGPNRSPRRQRQENAGSEGKKGIPQAASPNIVLSSSMGPLITFLTC
ncbi:hypothetical protein SODALDRAFT_348862 [Sodiomyces alkalinus F11]|uniref:Uncharacterized protein n=1 Tax=Sodiomyces alkalinus (strain CBS 110278 / VKM F-3762 / F11) TaxID=1314773 RepID=A0A3N2Q1N7_SODAK|nr:hypothetical protein SODALDRAFT_348862 [Sodiomyces alkalinus F11]ROT40671.1 hypothetical protein SODALDRAFT_348862 [Sodiomyces alkalinus F11]